MAICMIGDEQRVEIAAALERARQKPLMWDTWREFAIADERRAITLADRAPGFRRPPTERVMIPVGYRVQVSYEEQPAGMCLHVSVSVERLEPGKLPSYQAMWMIATEFGIDLDDAIAEDRIFVEEYEPGRSAINIIALVEPRPEGHA